MSFAHLQADVVHLLEHWDAPTAELNDVREEYLAHLAVHPDAVSRDGVSDHLTCGGFVFDPRLEHVALIMHRKARLWLQPGGHFESDDAGVIDAAVREVREETGLPVDDANAMIVDLHHHQLSAAFGRCTSHRDVRVAIVLDEPAECVVSEESDAAAWWPVDAIPQPTDPDLPATVLRIRDLLARRAGRPSAPAAAPSRS